MPGRPLRFRLFLLGRKRTAAAGDRRGHGAGLPGRRARARRAADRPRRLARAGHGGRRRTALPPSASCRASAVSDELDPERLPDFQAWRARVAADQGWRRDRAAADAQRQSAAEFVAQLDALGQHASRRPRKPAARTRHAAAGRGRRAEGPLQAGRRSRCGVPVCARPTVQYVLVRGDVRRTILAVVQRQQMPRHLRGRRVRPRLHPRGALTRASAARVHRLARRRCCTGSPRAPAPPPRWRARAATPATPAARWRLGGGHGHVRRTTPTAASTACSAR